MKEALTSRKAALALACITLLALALNCFQLIRQPVSEDDLSVAISAINYMENGQLGPTMWNHPCLRNILVYWALQIFGSGVLGVKGVSLLLGTLCTPLLGLVAGRLALSRRVGLIAALLWACDALVIDFSRQGINDIYLAFFPLAALYLMFRYRDGGSPWWLAGSGVCFGLGLASKWSALFPLVATLLFLLVLLLREKGAPAEARLARACLTAALLVLLPATVYLLTFFPWFGRGYTMSEWPALQKSMFLETSQHVGYHPKQWEDKDNRAYRWFIVPSVFVDPFMNMDRADGKEELPSMEQSVTVVLGVANPLVWLLTLPALCFVIRRGIRQREEGAQYLAALFLFSYLPLVCSPRPIWLNTALSVLPWAIIAVSWLVWTGAQRFQKPSRALALYLTLVVLVAAPLYLLAIGKGMRVPFMRGYLVQNYLGQFQKAMPPGPAPGRHAQ
jgi:dolichyl-phosphate-mannose-protein mannosyltransferase